MTAPGPTPEATDDYLPWAVDSRRIPEDVRTIVLGSRSDAIQTRALGAILYTDIVDSTSLIAELGNRQWRDLLEAHNALVRRELLRYGGREVDTAGDGFVAAFAGPSDAIACASAAVEAVRWISLDLRAGIHAGEFELLTERGGEPRPSGMAMAIGSRIMSLASPGEILVSDTVRQLLAGSEHTFDSRGSHQLKGVPGQWAVYSVAEGD